MNTVHFGWGRFSFGLMIGLFALLGAACSEAVSSAGFSEVAAPGTGTAASTAVEEAFRFSDVEEQTRRFIRYYNEIRLTPEQEAVKRESLGGIPAPCCDDNSAFDCCCPCNLAKTIWGLSHHLIAERNFGAGEVRETVQEWVRFINPDGYPGDACYTGGCGVPFAHGGCGGMSERLLVF